MLVTSNFPFTHSVFKRLILQTRKNQDLFGKWLRQRWADIRTKRSYHWKLRLRLYSHRRWTGALLYSIAQDFRSHWSRPLFHRAQCRVWNPWQKIPFCWALDPDYCRPWSRWCQYHYRSCWKRVPKPLMRKKCYLVDMCHVWCCVWFRFPDSNTAKKGIQLKWPMLHVCREGMHNASAKSIDLG